MDTWRALARPLFHVVAVAEALSWLGLTSGMWRAYVSGDGRGGIELFGPIHGGVFVAFVVVTIAAARTLRWRWYTVVLALAAAIPPLATVVFDVVAARLGWLDRQGERERSSGVVRADLAAARRWLVGRRTTAARAPRRAVGGR